ncbi:hypothetical protein CJ030_MR2G026827 [Morella rubra]|uniref:Uncharacterized protein n=1 Tax=Morella rubra TaxID=262757 RepID=A0A6A1WCZ2_9ROSI|nr:hypothetical protein CJ030_MR2G026827 [Morella rubra]
MQGRFGEEFLIHGFKSEKLSVHIPKGECEGVSFTGATLPTKIEMLVRGLIPIFFNKWANVPAEAKEYIMDRVLEDVRMVVETMMTTRRMHHNQMHAYFKKFLSKEAALLKPTLIPRKNSEGVMRSKRSEQNKKNRSKLTVNHATGSRSFSAHELACGEINPAELYKKNYTNKDGVWTSKGAREIYERMDAFQRQCDLEGKTYIEIELVKARDEIEAMRATREKDLQEFVKKQAEMEATLWDHREEYEAFGWSRRSA